MKDSDAWEKGNECWAVWLPQCGTSLGRRPRGCPAASELRRWSCQSKEAKVERISWAECQKIGSGTAGDISLGSTDYHIPARKWLKARREPPQKSRIILRAYNKVSNLYSFLLWPQRHKTESSVPIPTSQSGNLIIHGALGRILSGKDWLGGEICRPNATLPNKAYSKTWKTQIISKIISM